MRYLIYFPLFLLPLLAYNVAFLTGNTLDEDAVLVTFPLMASEAGMELHVRDLLLMSGVVLLYFELLKAARYTRSTIIDHALSMGVFILFLVEFIVVAGAGTGTFLTLTLMSLLDVVAGFTITISTARRDIGISPEAFGGE
jgi:hypothetical protein